MDNVIICPICSKIHSTINKLDKLRNDIHCRCKTKYWHTHIFWIHGTGYYYNNENFKMIPCIETNLCNNFCREPELKISNVCCFNCEKSATCLNKCKDKNCKNYKQSEV